MIMSENPQLIKLKDECNSLTEQVISGEITKDVFSKRYEILARQIGELEAKLSEQASKRDIAQSAVVEATYGYCRISTKEQETGEGLIRQKGYLDEYKKAQGIEYEDILIDERSGFHGHNLSKTSALGRFYQDVREGRIIRPTLVVENVDRLSRKKLSDALEIMLEMISKYSVSFYICSEKRLYREMNLETTLMLSLHIERSNSESAAKSTRTKKNWDAMKRDYKPGQILQYKPPGWIRKIYGPPKSDGKRGEAVKFALIDEHVKSAKLMFQWASEGLGASAIAGKLDETGRKPWGRKRGESEREHSLRRWQPILVLNVLASHAAFGEFRTQDGKWTIPNYYPAIIDRKLHVKANKSRKARKPKMTKTGDGRPGTIGLTLFIDGRSAYFSPRAWDQTKSGPIFRYYYRAGKGRACNGAIVEREIYDALLKYEPNPQSVFKSPLDENHSAKVTKLQMLEVRLSTYERAIEEGQDSRIIAEKIMKTAAEYDKLKKEVDRAEAIATSNSYFLKTRQRNLDALHQTKFEEREKLGAIFAQLIEGVDVSDKKLERIRLKGGGYVPLEKKH